jgi:MoaA/NifB/PqqE/SkfB family radical SAM enzyme
MFKFNELKSIHLEITNRCQASCPMCSRNVHGGIDNPNLKLDDWSLDDYKQIISSEVLAQLQDIYFCGNFGDPIINNNLIEMCRYSGELNPEINIRIHTNGGARNSNWWKELAESLPKNHKVIFGIDGLEDTHHIYRIGTTYDNVIKNAKTFIDAGGRAEWVFIKFKHNEHQEVEAKKRATELGFESFSMKNTTRFVGEPRFDVRDKQGNVLYYLEPPSDHKVKIITEETVNIVKSWTKQAEIECKVQELKEVYIDSHRHLYPCCFLASAPYYYTDPDSLINGIRKEIVNQHNDLLKDFNGIDSLDCTQRSLKDIIDSQEWQTVWKDHWDQKKLITCARICGKSDQKIFSSPTEQFIEKVNLNE